MAQAPKFTKPKFSRKPTKQSGQGSDSARGGGGAPFYKKGRSAGKPKIKEGIEARNVAVSILHDVLRLHKPLDEVLAFYSAKEPMASMSDRDRGFIRALASTSLRNFGAINFLLKKFMSKGFPRKSGTLKEILVTGVTQLLFLDTPSHAAISSAVDQVKFHKKTRPFANMANAVLRRTQREGEDFYKKQDIAKLNTPEWLRQRWTKHYGAEIANQIMQAHGKEAGLDLSAKYDVGELAKTLGATVLPTGSLRLAHKGMIPTIEGYDDGLWWVQDVAASLPVKLLGDIQGKNIADFCAAPGGKTAQLAALGADVTALDSSSKRLERVEENLQRLHLNAKIVCDDATSWQTNRLFDAIIIDAPCSATGTIRRHPDLPWLKDQNTITELVPLQRSILKNAIDQLKPNGILLYGTCSLEPEEGEKQIDWLLENYECLKIKPITTQEVENQQDWLTKEGFLRTLPHFLPHSENLPETLPAGMDGFFAARLIKT